MSKIVNNLKQIIIGAASFFRLSRAKILFFVLIVIVATAIRPSNVFRFGAFLFLLYAYLASCVVTFILIRLRDKTGGKGKLKPIIRLAELMVLLVLALVVSSYFEVKYRYASYISNGVGNDSKVQAVIVLGAKVYNDEILSQIYHDRIQTALELYRNGNTEKILISGDHGQKEYDEVNAAKDFLLGHGVPGDDIFLDHAGFDTYDSMYRARAVFDVKDAIIVTQAFHLPRAIYIARKLGIDVYGVSADKMLYSDAIWNNIRESLARVKAIIDVMLHSKPKYLGEMIPITGDGRLSWD